MARLDKEAEYIVAKDVVQVNLVSKKRKPIISRLEFKKKKYLSM